MVAVEGHAGIDAVAGGEDVAAVGHAVAEGIAGGFDYLCVVAGIHKAAIDIADEANLVADEAFYLGDVANMEVAFGGRHLIPLGEMAMQGMNAVERLHGEVEDQFKVRNTAGGLLALEGEDEFFAGSHAVKT